MSSVLSDTGHVGADAGTGASLHLWLKAAGPDRPASLSVTGHRPLIVAETAEFVFFSISVIGLIELDWVPAETLLSVAYLYDPLTVVSKGITLLALSAANQPPDQTQSYHFRPPLWLDERPKWIWSLPWLGSPVLPTLPA
jgi:hypothetical protein